LKAQKRREAVARPERFPLFSKKPHSVKLPSRQNATPAKRGDPQILSTRPNINSRACEHSDEQKSAANSQWFEAWLVM
jgi:hypothetical protein